MLRSRLCREGSGWLVLQRVHLTCKTECGFNLSMFCYRHHGLPCRYDEVILPCWQREPAQRPSFGMLQAALTRVQDEEESSL